LQHHNTHTHVVLTDYFAGEVLLELPTETHAMDASIWYEIQLSMHTAAGQVLSISRTLRPQTASIQTLSWPGSATITLNRQQQVPERPATVVVGQEYVLEANEIIVHDLMVGKFKNWVVTGSWPGAIIAGEPEIVTDRRLELIASAESKTYVAFYEYLQPAVINYLPYMSISN
jgi:hypothetical protein